MSSPPRPSRSSSASASALATLDRVVARTPDGRTLFSDLTLAFGRERTGLVGRNGAGKSTLIDILAGVRPPDDGAVSIEGRIGRLHQSPAADSLDGEVANALGVREALEVQARILAGDGAAEDFDRVDWTLDDRIGQALRAAGLDGLPLDRPVATLSGGQRTRLSLAALLADGPDLLLLDEPTNHLDVEGRAALATVLDGWRGGAVIASHDRALLNRMDRILELSELGPRLFGGGYDAWREARAAEAEAADRDLDAARRSADAARREAQRAVERQARRDRAGRAFRARGSEPKILLDARAERAEHTAARGDRLAERARGRAGEALEQARARVERARSLDIPIPPTGLPAGRTVLEMHGVAWADDQGRRRLGPLDLRLVGAERLGVTGPNGAGKSLLLNLISGHVQPTAGRIDRPVRVALLDQSVDLLRPDETVLDAWLRLNPEGAPNEAYAALARFLFRNVEALKRVGDLSGGERLRAGLACVMTGARPAQLLLLDEPTNHLDLDAVQAVEAALKGFDGALVVVSHDQAFLDAVGLTRRLVLQPQPATAPRLRAAAG